mgnify:FL=1
MSEKINRIYCLGKTSHYLEEVGDKKIIIIITQYVSRLMFIYSIKYEELEGVV